MIVDLAIDSENNFAVVTDKRLGSSVWIGGVIDLYQCNETTYQRRLLQDVHG